MCIYALIATQEETREYPGIQAHNTGGTQHTKYKQRHMCTHIHTDSTHYLLRTHGGLGLVHSMGGERESDMEVRADKQRVSKWTSYRVSTAFCGHIAQTATRSLWSALLAWLPLPFFLGPLLHPSVNITSCLIAPVDEPCRRSALMCGVQNVFSKLLVATLHARTWIWTPDSSQNRGNFSTSARFVFLIFSAVVTFRRCALVFIHLPAGNQRSSRSHSSLRRLAEAL